MAKVDPDLKNFFTLLQNRIGEIPPKRYLKIDDIKNICGVDVSYGGPRAVAAAVLRNISKKKKIEVSLQLGQPTFPYIPGLLFIREAPIMTTVINKLSVKPNVVFVDGHGIAHPRKAGLAVLVGLVSNIPSIGIAKSLLIGEIGEFEGGFAPIILEGSTVGYKMQCSGRVYYISPGYGIDVSTTKEILENFSGDCLDVLSEADRLSREFLK